MPFSGIATRIQTTKTKPIGPPFLTFNNPLKLMAIGNG